MSVFNLTIAQLYQLITYLSVFFIVVAFLIICVFNITRDKINFLNNNLNTDKQL